MSFSHISKAFLPKSEWEQNPNKLPTKLLKFMEKVTQTMTWLKLLHNKPNLTPQEEEGFLEVQKGHSIVKKQADKGSATVIIGRTDCVKEGLWQCQDTTYYKPLRKPTYPAGKRPTQRKILLSLTKEPQALWKMDNTTPNTTTIPNNLLQRKLWHCEILWLIPDFIQHIHSLWL